MLSGTLEGALEVNRDGQKSSVVSGVVGVE